MCADTLKPIYCTMQPEIFCGHDGRLSSLHAADPAAVCATQGTPVNIPIHAAIELFIFMMTELTVYML